MQTNAKFSLTSAFFAAILLFYSIVPARRGKPVRKRHLRNQPKRHHPAFC